MRRREFIGLLGCTAAQSLVRPPSGLAQTAPKIFKIGHINSAPQLVLTSPLGKVLEKSFQQRGYHARQKSCARIARGGGTS